MSTAADQKSLQSRHLKKPYDITYIYPTNTLKNEHNKTAMEGLTGEMSVFKAVDKMSAKEGSAQAARDREQLIKMPTHQTSGLPHELKLKKGVPVEVTTNVDVNDGLCNGSDGHFRASTNGRLWVQFQAPTAGMTKRSQPLTKMLQQSNELAADWLPIETTCKDIYTKGSKRTLATRKQYPVVLAFARTTHHSQGSIYEIGGVDMGGGEKPFHPPGIHYVSLARYTHLNKVWLHNFDVKDASVSSAVVKEMERMRQEATLQITTP